MAIEELLTLYAAWRLDQGTVADADIVVEAVFEGKGQCLTCHRVNDKGSPVATRNCSRTRSRPVTSSVTGCSTCSRVFISRK